MVSSGSATNVTYFDPTGTSNPSAQVDGSARADSLASQLRDSLLIVEITYSDALIPRRSVPLEERPPASGQLDT